MRWNTMAGGQRWDYRSQGHRRRGMVTMRHAVMLYTTLEYSTQTNKFIRSKVKSKTRMVILAVFLAIPYNWEFRIYFVLKILQSQWFDSKWIVSFCTCTRWLTVSVIAFPVENLFGSVWSMWPQKPRNNIPHAPHYPQIPSRFGEGQFFG